MNSDALFCLIQTHVLPTQTVDSPLLSTSAATWRLQAENEFSHAGRIGQISIETQHTQRMFYQPLAVHIPPSRCPWQCRRVGYPDLKHRKLYHRGCHQVVLYGWIVAFAGSKKGSSALPLPMSLVGDLKKISMNEESNTRYDVRGEDEEKSWTSCSVMVRGLDV